MHMSVQLKKMEGKLRSVDLVVEVVSSFLSFIAFLRFMMHGFLLVEETRSFMNTFMLLGLIF